MKTYRKQLKDIREKSQHQQKDLTVISERGVFFDFRNHNPILMGKEAVEFMRKHYGKIVPQIFSHGDTSPLNFECWKVVSGCVNNPGLITQNIVFQLESGDRLVWPPRYSDPDKRVYPLLGVQS